MGFLEPIWFLLAGAAAVPLIVHFLRRRIGSRVEFPAARYLLRAEKEHSRKLKLRHLLLLILRVLAVLCIAAAAARPVARLGGGGHAPLALAIVVDNSLSTTAISGGRPVLDQLRSAARAAVSRATLADRVWLVTADGRVTGGTPAAVGDAIERVTALAGAGDLPGAVRRAAALAINSGLAVREVAVVTDAQATSWTEGVSPGDVRVRALAPALAPPGNRAVLAAEARPLQWTPSGAVSARVQSTDSVTYRLTIQSERGEARTLARGTVGPDGEILVHSAPPERGWVSGSVELEPDEMRGDDVRHFAAWIGNAPLVAADPSAGVFARSAVDALLESGRAQRGGAAPGTIAVTGAEAVSRLPALIAAPLDPVRLGAANRALERLGIPWRFGATRTGETVVKADSQVLRGFDGVTVSLRYALERRGGGSGDTLATAGGEPWIVAGEGWVLVASPMIPDATTLPVRAIWVPWLAEVVTLRLNATAGSAETVGPGAALRRPAWADALEVPGGTPLALAGATMTAPVRPGVYFYLRGGSRAGALVVAAEPDESRLARLSPAELKAKLDAKDVEVSADAGQWSSALFDVRERRSLAAAFLVAALLLLVAETVVSRAHGRALGRTAGAAPAPGARAA